MSCWENQERAILQAQLALAEKAEREGRVLKYVVGVRLTLEGLRAWVQQEKEFFK